jgi:hypothetical protein
MIFKIIYVFEINYNELKTGIEKKESLLNDLIL